MVKPKESIKPKININMGAEFELISRGMRYYLVLRKIGFYNGKGASRQACYVPEIEIPISIRECKYLEGRLTKTDLEISANLEFKVKEAPPLEEEDESHGLY